MRTFETRPPEYKSAVRIATKSENDPHNDYHSSCATFEFFLAGEMRPTLNLR